MKTKDLILKVAEEEFSKLGYDAVSMNNLVKKLDINKATIYYHFKDKKTLYHEVLKNVITEMNLKIRSVFMGNLDGETLFRVYVNTIVLSIKQRPSIVSLAFREMANYGANVDNSLVPYIEEEIKYIEMIMKRLDLKDFYKNINQYALLSLIHGTIKEFYVIQMSTLSIGGKSELKQNSDKTLNYISEFISNIILDAIVENNKK